MVMGSANLTWDGLGKNLELAWYYATDEPDEVYLPTSPGWRRSRPSRPR